MGAPHKPKARDGYFHQNWNSNIPCFGRSTSALERQYCWKERGRSVPPSHDERDVIGRRCPAGPLRDRAVHRLDDGLSGFIDANRQRSSEAFLPELLSPGTGRFRDAVGVDDQHVPALELDPVVLVLRRGTMPRTGPPPWSSSKLPEARTNSGGLWPALAYESSPVAGSSTQKNMLMNRLSGVRRRCAIQAAHYIGKVPCFVRERLDARLKVHHHQGRRHPLARNVAQNHRHSPVGIRKKVVIIASHGAARRVISGQVGSGHNRRFGGKEPLPWISAACSRSRAKIRSACSTSASRACSMPNGGHIRHHGQQVQILAGELSCDEAR